jgi:hypothetical protein
MQVRRARFEKPSSWLRDFDPDVERFLARALRSERSKRFQSADQMAERLDKILTKLGQPTGPSALKRWLDALSARDGARPPGEAQDAPLELPASTMQLGSAELELADVAPRGADDDEEPLQDLSNAKTEFAFAHEAPRPARTRENDAATVVAHAGYPNVDDGDEAEEAEPERHAITIVVPNGATVIGLDPSDDQVKVRHEGLTSDGRDAEGDTTQLYNPAYNPERVDEEPERAPPSELSLQVEFTTAQPAAPALPEPAASANRDSLLVVVDEEKPPARVRPRRRFWRFGLTTLLAAALLGRGLIAARPYLPGEYVPAEWLDVLEHWVSKVEALPRSLRDSGARLGFGDRRDDR